MALPTHYDVMMSVELHVFQNSFVDVGPCVIRVGTGKDAETESKEPESWVRGFPAAGGGAAPAQRFAGQEAANACSGDRSIQRRPFGVPPRRVHRGNRNGIYVEAAVPVEPHQMVIGNFSPRRPPLVAASPRRITKRFSRSTSVTAPRMEALG